MKSNGQFYSEWEIWDKSRNIDGKVMGQMRGICPLNYLPDKCIINCNHYRKDVKS